MRIKKIIASLLVVWMLLSITACTNNVPSSETQPSTATPTTSTPVETTVPPTTLPPTTQEPTLPDYPTGIDVKGVTFNRIDQDTFTFTTDEFPGAVFHGYYYHKLAIEEDGNRIELLTYAPIMRLCLTDLNNDGLRELVIQYSKGSGIVSYEIFVFDYANMKSYVIEERSQGYDYSYKVVDGQMIVRRSHTYGWMPVSDGRLLLYNDQLIFDNDLFVIYGHQVDPVLDQNEIENVYTIKYDYSNHYKRNEAIDYYISKHEEPMGRVFTYYGGDDNRSFVEITRSNETEKTKELFRSFNSIGYLTNEYIGYYYYDAENPGRLFVCSEFRDLGYKYIRDYYEDLMAGRCSAHEETFLISLDELAIYRWGSDENLYNDIVS